MIIIRNGQHSLTCNYFHSIRQTQSALDKPQSGAERDTITGPREEEPSRTEMTLLVHDGPMAPGSVSNMHTFDIAFAVSAMSLLQYYLGPIWHSHVDGWKREVM